MATMSEPQSQSGGFKLSQLVYDTRYRSMTIQVVAFILIMMGLVWLANNTVQNLEALGKDFDFGFLGSRAGYDINQQLLQYSNDSVHGRAALAGILNTLLVALVGCFLATVFGVFAGVLRLSNNWIVARLMAVYVEGFRNIPTLLWILLVFAIFSEALPTPREFRADGSASFWFFGNVAVTNQGSFVPRLVFAEGAFPAFLFAIIVAMVLSSLLKRWAAGYQARTGQVIPTSPISLGIFAVALILTFFVMSSVAGNRTVNFIAAGATEGQSAEEYAAAVDGRIDYCNVPKRVSTMNAGAYYLDAGGQTRNVDFGNLDAAILGLASGNCELLAVPQSDLAETLEILELVSSTSFVVDQRVSGIAFVPNPDDGALTRAPLEIGVLSDELQEGRAFQVSTPSISESGIPRFEGGWHIRNSFIALTLALALYTGAFIAENVRGGILAISRGQTEAAYALGLRPSRTMSLVILPQAMRVIIPPLISQYLNLTKNSSLAIAVGYMDVRSTLGGITINQTGRELEGMLLMGLFYLITSLIISGSINIYNRSVALKER